MVRQKCLRCSFLNEGGHSQCQKCGAPLSSVSFEADETPQKAAPQQDGGQRVSQFQRGQVINNRYTILGVIGRGGMGCIYKVHDNVLGEDLALKTLLPQFTTEKMVIDRFLNEARITRKLTHPNVVRVHDISTTGQGIFISMEYVEGQSLRALLDRLAPGERMPARQVLHIIDQLCLALDYAHAYTIHRDIKPENVMITKDNQIKLMDFGISKLMDNRFATSVSMVMGTPYYMSPEQYRNSRDVDARADIYSVGIVLYEMLTGHLPVGSVGTPASLAVSLPPALRGIVEKCIDPDRNKRYESAGSLRESIEPILEMLNEGKDPQKTLSRRRYGHSKSSSSIFRILVFGIAAAVIVGIGLMMLFVLEKSNAAAPDGGAYSAVSVGKENDPFAALEQQVQILSSVVDKVAKSGNDASLWAIKGRKLWEEAQAPARQGNEDALLQASDAVQHMMAALMCPQDMCFVPAGYVNLDGAPVYVPGFLIDIHEVSTKDFALFLDNMGAKWSASAELKMLMSTSIELPVSYVSWFDAQGYAAFAGKQLPSRRQWERAAHGDAHASSLYPWGDEWKEGAANVHTDSSRPSASFSEDLSWAGCYDMAGNVAEWTGSAGNPLGAGERPDFGDKMYICGGSFLKSRFLNQADYYDFEGRSSDLGFRCVIPLIPSLEEATRLAAEKR